MSQHSHFLLPERISMGAVTSQRLRTSLIRSRLSSFSTVSMCWPPARTNLKNLGVCVQGVCNDHVESSRIACDNSLEQSYGGRYLVFSGM